ncbi:chitinase 2-like [Syzygium oleosum]|uniref:chitinase 2-like n=1 Tax=Syzygium oleosum TaxID=219896 RepID=UPI0011D1970D|nr:chitinase 2-like [Syzygium oleosum]
MEFRGALSSTLFLLFLYSTNAGNSKLFREYIGAESDTIQLSDVPVNSEVEFHFILAFAIDYTSEDNPSPTNGKFNVFWETNHLTPSAIASFKQKHPNVKFAVSLGGDSIGNSNAFFVPKSTNSWVQNAISSLTAMIKEYHLDGIDIDYEHFNVSSSVFAYCIGQLVTRLKKSRVISFASIAPYEDIQNHYLALWKKYGSSIDYVNFQFYAYNDIGVSQFQSYYKQQASNFEGGQVLASFMSKGGGGLHPNEGFFQACEELKNQGKLGGIFIWCADDSIGNHFQFEKQSQQLLAA